MSDSLTTYEITPDMMMWTGEQWDAFFWRKHFESGSLFRWVDVADFVDGQSCERDPEITNMVVRTIMEVQRKRSQAAQPPKRRPWWKFWK